VETIITLGIVGILTAAALGIITVIMYGYDLWARRRLRMALFTRPTLQWTTDTHKEIL
jgi:predicted outer membrane lipoprotein